METSFQEFTVSLLTGTMDALTASALQQMKSYAELVSTIEAGLSAFQSQMNPPSGDAIAAWIAQNLPDVSINSSTDAVTISSGTNWSAASTTALTNLFTRAGRIAGTTLKLADATPHAVDSSLAGTPIVAAEFVQGTSVTMVPANAHDLKSLPTAGVATILDALNGVLNDESSLAYSELNALVKMGLIQVKAPTASITAKATFNLVANDQFNQATSDVSTSTLSSSLYGGVAWRWLNLGVRASYSNFNIKVATASSSSTTTITETVTGEVHFDIECGNFPSVAVPASV